MLHKQPRSQAVCQCNQLHKYDDLTNVSQRVAKRRWLLLVKAWTAPIVWSVAVLKAETQRHGALLCSTTTTTMLEHLKSKHPAVITQDSRKPGGGGGERSKREE